MPPKPSELTPSNSRKSSRETKQTSDPTPHSSAIQPENKKSTSTSKGKAKAAPEPKATPKKNNKRKAKEEVEEDQDDEDEDEDEEEEEEEETKVEGATPKSKKSTTSTTSTSTSEEFSDYAFLFSGKLKVLTRDQAGSRCKSKGGKVTSTLTKATTHVVIGDDPGESKLEKIKERKDLKILTEEEFMKLIGMDFEEENEKKEEKKEEKKSKGKASKVAKIESSGESSEKSPKKVWPSTDISSLEKSDFTSLNGLTVLFTGTMERDRKEIQALATKAGATVAKGVTGAVNLVVVGVKAGPKKLLEIQSKGLKTTDEAGFLKLVEGQAGSSGNGVASTSAIADEKEKRDEADDPIQDDEEE